MSDQCEDCGRIHYDYGDRVRLVQNHLLTGQIIGERNWGQEYLVRIGATITSLWFENVELEPDEDFEPEPDLADNVIPFKRAGGLN